MKSNLKAAKESPAWKEIENGHPKVLTKLLLMNMEG